jgi:hypothetical protein
MILQTAESSRARRWEMMEEISVILGKPLRISRSPHALLSGGLYERRFDHEHPVLIS